MSGGSLPKILLTGATGLIGQALTAALSASGRRVVPLSRRPGTPGAILWDPMAEQMDAGTMAGVDAVIHLAGESVAQGRWTPEKKRRLMDSRVRSTSLIARTIAQLNPRPRAFLCASGIGYYGNRGDEELTEDSPPGSGFLAEICKQTQQAAAPAEAAGIRVVHMIIGMVLTQAGGALGQMLTPFRLGIGGTLGNGRQFMSWITLDDLIAAMLYLLDHEELKGGINLVAPQPVTNREFTKSLGRALHRPTFMAMPAFAARLIFGEMADELLLASTRVVPNRLTQAGFKFRQPELSGALAELLPGRGRT